MLAKGAAGACSSSISEERIRPKPVSRHTSALHCIYPQIDVSKDFEVQVDHKTSNKNTQEESAQNNERKKELKLNDDEFDLILSVLRLTLRPDSEDIRKEAENKEVKKETVQEAKNSAVPIRKHSDLILVRKRIKQADRSRLHKSTNSVFSSRQSAIPAPISLKRNRSDSLGSLSYYRSYSSDTESSKRFSIFKKRRIRRSKSAEFEESKSNSNLEGKEKMTVHRLLRKKTIHLKPDSFSK